METMTPTKRITEAMILVVLKKVYDRLQGGAKTLGSELGLILPSNQTLNNKLEYLFYYYMKDLGVLDKAVAGQKELYSWKSGKPDTTLAHLLLHEIFTHHTDETQENIKIIKNELLPYYAIDDTNDQATNTIIESEDRMIQKHYSLLQDIHATILANPHASVTGILIRHKIHNGALSTALKELGIITHSHNNGWYWGHPDLPSIELAKILNQKRKFLYDSQLSKRVDKKDQTLRNHLASMPNAKANPVGRPLEPVFQFEPNGTLIKEWSSVREASDNLKIKKIFIAECVKGDRPRAGGFLWSKTKELDPRHFDKSTNKPTLNVTDLVVGPAPNKKAHGRSKPVYQFTLDGKPIKEWPSQVAAGKELGIDQAYISRCTGFKSEQAGGFLWQSTPEFIPREKIKKAEKEPMVNFNVRVAINQYLETHHKLPSPEELSTLTTRAPLYCSKVLEQFVKDNQHIVDIPATDALDNAKTNLVKLRKELEGTLDEIDGKIRAMRVQREAVEKQLDSVTTSLNSLKKAF